MDFCPKDPLALPPNSEVVGSQPTPAKKQKAGPGKAASTSKRKRADSSSSKSTKKLEKEKSAKLKQSTLSFKKGSEDSSALENIVIFDR